MERKNQIESLEMRIVELENELKTLRASREPVDISAEELKAYQKVRGVMRQDVDFCGINDCKPCTLVHCDVAPVQVRWPEPCIYECSCGPCSYYNPARVRVGGGRFGGLGQ